MTARITGFVTRAQAGLRAPRSYSRNISPAGGGVALHYGGPATNLGDHSTCVRLWRQWQSFHMDSRGWADIAYTMGVCDHGYALAGRGAGVRTAAQGTDYGNDRYYAVVWLGGEGETPSKAALDAFEWCVLALRKADAGSRVRPHKVFHSTSCPGPVVTRHAMALDGKPISPEQPPAPAPTPTPTPTPQEDDMAYHLVADPSGSGADFGTNGVTKFSFPSQTAKNEWATAFKATRITLSKETLDAIPTVAS